MAEFDFYNASLKEIVDAYLADGCVLLRRFLKPESLACVGELVNSLSDKSNEAHIEPQHLRKWGLPLFHERLFENKHLQLLDFLFRDSGYEVSERTATRRIGINPDGQWQAPLGPHLDSFFHPLPFTVNFWVPLQECGMDAPSLAVVQAPFDEVIDYTGYERVSDNDVGPFLADHADWNFTNFDRRMYALACNEPNAIAHLRQRFGARIWAPTYSVGDAMMSSNWTLHFTHALPGMQQRRSNLELRFSSELTLAKIIAMHQRN